MQSTAEVIWQGREEPVVFLDSLKEAHLFFLEGMKNGLSPSYTESSVTFSVVFDSIFSNWWCHYQITLLYMVKIEPLNFLSNGLNLLILSQGFRLVCLKFICKRKVFLFS